MGQCVDTSSSSVDTRGLPEHLLGKTGQVVSTLDQGRVEEFLAAGEAGDPHTKPFFFPVVSAATCTDSHLEVDQRARRVSKGSNLAPMTASHRYTVNHGVTMTFKRKSKLRMGMRPSDERSNYESSYSRLL
ncbi:hypothetical protein Taro_010098 [Colocasia esculenta]|uniref:Uncharacterized protein n=1 Tax=Colocasia esculenta TaxID=4460 RepID=A0A843U8I9_COLES|nr:hypothetical protein [Colocasia esculenta]